MPKKKVAVEKSGMRVRTARHGEIWHVEAGSVSSIALDSRLRGNDSQDRRDPDLRKAGFPTARE
jgi:hypothetical protein